MVCHTSDAAAMSAEAAAAAAAEHEAEREKMLAQMNPKQLAVIRAIEAGESVFLTGLGGVGKSFVVYFLQKYGRVKASVTAPTGVAAVNIDGMTIHSWGGLGIGKDSPEAIASKLKRGLAYASSPKCKAAAETFPGYRIKNCELLVIDEISMMPHDLFYMLDYVCRDVRGVHNKPFGGIQLLLVGDFFQLPPIFGKVDQCKTCFADAEQGPDGLYRCTVKREFRCRTRAWDGVQRFAFDDSVKGDFNLWDKCGLEFHELTDVVRQKDAEFIEILNAIRTGDATPEQYDKLLEECEEDTIDETDGILATALYCRNANVDEKNGAEYRKLPATTLEVIYKGIASTKCIDRKSKDFGKPVEKSRMLANLTKHVPAQGVLRLKVGTQVMLTTNVNVSLGLCNGARGVVVGFRRAGADVKTDSIGSVESPLFTGIDRPIYYPVVKFFTANGEHITTAVAPHTWENETSVEKATYTQVPLRHAWAITIHKCQGSTFTKVRVHIEDAFSDGQVYVALSRSVGMRGHLHIVSFDPDKITVSDKVKAWYAKQRRRIVAAKKQKEARKRKADADAADADAAAAATTETSAREAKRAKEEKKDSMQAAKEKQAQRYRQLFGKRGAK